MSIPASGGPSRPVARNRLGRSDVLVSALALGGAPLAGLYRPVPEPVATATVRAAWETGLHYVDTAPHYGLGRSEQLVGSVLRELPRDSFTLSTKVGRRLRPLAPGEAVDPQGFANAPPRRRYWDFTAAGIRSALLESLDRLGLDRVDIVLLHDPDDHEEEAIGTAFPALARLRDEGVVGAIGAGMNQTAMLTRFVDRFDLDVVLCAGRYTLLDRSALADLFPACERRGTSVVIGGVYNSGLLADPRPGARFDYAPAPEPTLRLAQETARLCAEHDVPVRAAALRFAAAHPVVAAVLVGCRSPAEVADNRAMWEHPIPAELWDRLPLEPDPRPVRKRAHPG
ncbi:aldo/keto reductase [Marinactinospora rubrisoli]|uniref:Aldo/keto reductase n=1 Tax=Marinactinospora rubrisoli TaxID=2715399 RepID=A0ABW2KFR0_9ACTN